MRFAVPVFALWLFLTAKSVISNLERTHYRFEAEPIELFKRHHYHFESRH